MFRHTMFTIVSVGVLAATIGMLSQPTRASEGADVGRALPDTTAGDVGHSPAYLTGPPPKQKPKKAKPKQHDAQHKDRAHPQKMQQKERAHPREAEHRERVSPHKDRATPIDGRKRSRVRDKKTYLRTRDRYRHVRIAQHHRRDDGRVYIRPIIQRSVTVLPSVLDRFEGRRRSDITLIIQHLNRGERRRAIELWGRFVEGLVDYRDPIDLDEIVVYIVREGCVLEDETFRFYALKLEFLKETEDRLEDYIYGLYDRREACTRLTRRCPGETVRDIETELARAQGERDVVRAKVRAANDEFEAILRGSRDYERRFHDVFEDLYREVEIRIRISG
ncbi:MAG: hypothetical protein JSU63_06365 [Phycisphaerales bacterium]|nr:MAG: hypothetical protein JSU63_06365 [Phycisphaerales bacterium]